MGLSRKGELGLRIVIGFLGLLFIVAIIYAGVTPFWDVLYDSIRGLFNADGQSVLDSLNRWYIWFPVATIVFAALFFIYKGATKESVYE